MAEGLQTTKGEMVWPGCQLGFMVFIEPQTVDLQRCARFSKKLMNRSVIVADLGVVVGFGLARKAYLENKVT